MKSGLFRVLILALVLMLPITTSTVFAKDSIENVTGERYEFSEKDGYAFDEGKGSLVSKNENYGAISIKGDYVKNKEGVYYIQKGLLDIGYDILYKGFPSDDQWHITKDKSKTVNGVKLNSNIMSGAIIVQSSLDGENWIVDATYTDVSLNSGGMENSFFTTNELHQANGCFYRVTIAYKLERKIGSSKFLFWDNNEYEYKNIAEVYNFYVIDQDTVDNGAASSDIKPRKEFSTVVNTGKDNGFDITKSKPMDKDDPHFNETIGYFTVNGYTRETSEKDGTPVFLKTLGDNVTLWFNLTEDINKLFGNENLKISEDNKTYDKAMGVEETNFKHGALIVKYTDEEGHSPETIKYFDFLAANTMTGADTRIKLYEEGNYEVTLDYEIVNTKGIKSYTNYKVYFKFAIRNGNTMAFPRDSVTGSELKDGAHTVNGFMVDLAESKYLTIDIVRKEINLNADGTISTSTRNNSVGKDGSTYTKPGVYEVTVKNQYSDGNPTTVTLYVGQDKNIVALSRYHMTVEELNEMIKIGAFVEEDGSLKIPKGVEEPQVVQEEDGEPTVLDDMILESEKETENDIAELEESISNVQTVELEKSQDTMPIMLVTMIAIVVGGLIVILKFKNREGKKADE